MTPSTSPTTAPRPLELAIVLSPSPVPRAYSLMNHGRPIRRRGGAALWQAPGVQGSFNISHNMEVNTVYSHYMDFFIDPWNRPCKFAGRKGPDDHCAGARH